MIKRTVEISRQPTHLAVRNDQLLLWSKGESRELMASIPCEDIGLLIVDHPQATYSHPALTALASCGAAVVFCGRDHLPTGILLPMADHTEVVWRVRLQTGITKPLRKQLWKQIVQAKIRAQADNLSDGSAEQRRLRSIARNVRSGDPSNAEAHAARLYWSVWLGNEQQFRRNADGEDPANALLNYGYAIMRAAVARALVAAGLLPAIGLHHSNRSNAFCLADDLLEPLRPIVDARVRSLLGSGADKLDQPTKAALLNLMTVTVSVNNRTGPLMVGLHRTVASLVQCLGGESRILHLPVLTDEPADSDPMDDLPI